MGNGDARLIGVFALLIVALFLKAAPLGLPAVRADNPPGAFDAARAIERLSRILGDERPHPVDSDENDAVRARLLAEIEALGYAPETRDDFVCTGRWSGAGCARVKNVIFRAGPEDGEALMVASHYDSVPAGPGASDDGIGVAASLEIAALVKDEPLSKPVLFLITDGEEMGLLGAKSFAEIDPYKDKISRVINMEARGVRGPAQMFQTAQPNGADVAAFAQHAARPFANSMMTDIYRLLPNDTDVTEFLPLGYGAINMALTEGVEFYHTPHDNLASLDPKSVQHMGDLALGAVRASLAQGMGAGAGQLAFTDILSRAFVMLPQSLAGMLLGLGAILSLTACLRAGGGATVRALAAPPLTLIGAAALAFGLQYLIGLVRPRQLYWMAQPEATQLLAYLSAALAALAAAAFVSRRANPRRLAAAAWLWIALIALCGFFIAPGSSILFLLPLAAYGVGAAAGLIAPVAERVGVWAGAILMLIVFAPALHLAELGLGFAVAAVPAAVAALLFMAWTPLAATEGAHASSKPVVFAAAGLAAVFVLTLIVPAYSPTKPRPLNLQYHIDADAREARWLISSTGEPAPKALAALAPFAKTEIEGLGPRLAAPAPFLETAPPTIEALEETPLADGRRRLRLRLHARGADQVMLRLPGPARASVLWAAGRETDLAGGELADEENGTVIRCYGRSCDGAEIEIALSAEPTEWMLLGLHYGLPYAAAPLVSARPDWTTPIQNGDVLIVSSKIKV